MRIKGRLVKNIEQVDDYKEAEIELSEQELVSQLPDEYSLYKDITEKVFPSPGNPICTCDIENFHKNKDGFTYGTTNSSQCPVHARKPPEKPKEEIEAIGEYHLPNMYELSQIKECYSEVAKAIYMLIEKHDAIIPHLSSPKY